MLPRHLRLSKNADILNVMRRGNKISTPYVHVHFLKRPNGESSRVACVVSKKVHKSAVKRHYYQRWLRNISHPYLSRLPVAYDMVWAARPGIVEVSKITTLQNSLQPQLEELLKDLSTSQSVNPPEEHGRS